MERNNYRGKWWSRVIRERNYFGFRYWWFNWLLLIGTCLAFYLLWTSASFKSECCSENDSLFNVNNIIKELDNCCPCRNELLVYDTITPSIPPEDAKPCDSNAMEDAGGYGVKKTDFILGTKSGEVTINYDMKKAPDKLEVFYEGKLIGSTFSVRGNEDGFVGGDNSAGGNGTIRFNYIFNHDQHVTVIVTGKDTGTEWFYSLGCPK